MSTRRSSIHLFSFSILRFSLAVACLRFSFIWQWQKCSTDIFRALCDFEILQLTKYMNSQMMEENTSLIKSFVAMYTSDCTYNSCLFISYTAQCEPIYFGTVNFVNRLLQITKIRGPKILKRDTKNFLLKNVSISVETAYWSLFE